MEKAYFYTPSSYIEKILKITLTSAINFTLLVVDLNYDLLDEIDENDPFKGIAEKLILNSFNGE